jgi:GGDEF domain-containing protein
MLVDQVATLEAVATIASKMQSTVSLPFLVEGKEVFLTSRIGITFSSREAADAASLLRMAYQAVQQARAESFVIAGPQTDLPDPPSDTALPSSTTQAA